MSLESRTAFGFRLCLSCLILILPEVASAVDVTGGVRVEVRSAGETVEGAVVEVTSLSTGRVARARTGADGVARLEALVIGDYAVAVNREGFAPSQSDVVVTAAGTATVETSLTPSASDEAAIETEGEVIEVRAGRVLLNTRNPIGNGNRVDFNNRTSPQQLSANNATQAVVSTVPGIQTNSLGQFHPRGEHKGVSISVDGVNIPLPSEDPTSQIIDPRLLQAMDVQTGFFDSSAGGQLGALLNLATPEGGLEPYAEVTPYFGDFSTSGVIVKSGGSFNEGRGSIFVGGLGAATSNKLEPLAPDAQTLGNEGSDTNVLLRITDAEDGVRLGGTFSHHEGDYGVPQNRANFDAGVAQTQRNRNTMGVFSARKDLEHDQNLLFGFAYLRSHQSVEHNGVFTPFTVFGANADPAPEGEESELTEEGFPDQPEIAGSPYLPTVDREVTQIQPTLEFRHDLGEDHWRKLGITANFINSEQFSQIIDAGGGGGLPNPGELDPAPTDFTSSIVRDPSFWSVYYSETLPVGDTLIANVGMRGDRYDNDAGLQTGQLSPRLNLTYPLDERHAIRASYNRVFQIPPIELNPQGDTFVLPQRTHQSELAYDFQPGDNLVGKAALVYKDFQDQLDVALFIPNSNIPLFSPINFGTAFYKGAEFQLQSTNRTGFNGNVSATYGVARPLTLGPFGDELPRFNDHDQRYQVSGGLSHTWKNGLFAGIDGIYSTGFPQEAIPLYNEEGVDPFGLNGSRFDRFISNLTLSYFPTDGKGRAQETGVGASLVIQNLFDNDAPINFLSEFSGTRFVQGRRAIASATLRF